MLEWRLIKVALESPDPSGLTVYEPANDKEKFCRFSIHGKPSFGELRNDQIVCWDVEEPHSDMSCKHDWERFPCRYKDIYCCSKCGAKGPWKVEDQERTRRVMKERFGLNV